MQQKIKQFSLKSLETIINKLLVLEPHNKKYLSQLNNKEICIFITNLNLSVHASLNNEYLFLDLNKEKDSANVIISGNSASFIKFLALTNIANNSGTSNTSNNSLSNLKGISFSGDLETARALQELIANLEIDWEEQLSHITGDIIAHQIGNLFRSTKLGLRSASGNLQEMLTEYIHFEARLSPTKEEVAEFINNVDDIRNDQDRLNEKIKHLETVFTSIT